MRKPNYFGTNLSKLRLNGFLMAGLLGGASTLNATPGTPTPKRKRENTLAGAKTSKPEDLKSTSNSDLKK
jgi:hypothetical protein